MSAEDSNMGISENARKLLPPSRLEELKQAFMQIDTNRDGKVDLNEYLDYLLAQERTRIVRQFEYLDADRDGSIDFEEFLSVSEPHYRILKKFREFDTDGNGLLKLEEALQIAEALSFPINKEELQKLIETVDRDGDGELTYDEYLGAVIRFGFQ